MASGPRSDMQILLDIIVPIFGIVFLGYGVVRFGLFSESATNGLSTFVFNFAIPALMFRAMATQDFPDDIEWGFLIAYFGGGYAAWAIGLLVSRYAFRRDFATASIVGMGGAFGNTVLLGIPLILTIYGDEGALPVFLIIAFHSWQLMSVITILIEGSRGNRAELWQIPRNIAKGLVRNPIIVAVLLGLAWQLTGIPLPKVADQLTATLGRAALPCAIFAMGASLAGYRIGGAVLGEAMLMTALKLGLHPLLVFLIGHYVFDLEPLWLHVAVIVSSVPVGVNVYLFGARYNAGEAQAATAIILSTTLSVGTITLLLATLGVR